MDGWMDRWMCVHKSTHTRKVVEDKNKLTKELEECKKCITELQGNKVPHLHSSALSYNTLPVMSGDF